MHKAISKALTIALCAGTLVLAACTQQPASRVDDATTFSNTENQIDEEHNEMENENLQILDGTLLELFRGNEVTLLQFEPLTPGEELAVLHTNKGDITLRFFPDDAPKAVENFITHAKNGYYDGLIFHRVIPGFMIQGGCPNGTGTGGTSIWGEGFSTEPSINLRHFRGALAMAHAGPGTIGSQFYIVQNDELDPHTIAQFQDIIAHQDEVIGKFSDGTIVRLGDFQPTAEMEHYIANGGTPHLDWLRNQQGGHPVFGHVVEGLDIVDAIANTPQGAGNRPVDDVIIESISFITYGE
jgi:peptidyl-prolyl cis-trans isomerase B (cyclophilin B)